MLELLILVRLQRHLLHHTTKMETINEPLEPLLHRQTERLRRSRPRSRPRLLHTPRISHHSTIINTTLMQSLQPHLPTRYQLTDWQSVYSTTRHGISLNTFFTNVRKGPTVLVIRDQLGAIFGYYTSVGWKQSNQYYGTGESFVFTLVPEMRVYKWSKINPYHQLSSESIAVGGGGKFALFVDGFLERGSSGCCQTYASPCLASDEEFEVIELEAYALVPPYKLEIGEE